MRRKIARHGRLLVVSLLEPRLDAHLSVTFKQAVSDLIAEGSRHIVVDLAEVEFIDSSGLGALVAILKSLGDEGTLILTSLCQPVAAMFRLTRMDKVFAIYSTPAAACDALSAPADKG